MLYGRILAQAPESAKLGPKQGNGCPGLRLPSIRGRASWPPTQQEGRDMKRALVVWGGLELHEPEAGALLVRDLLQSEGFDVTVTPDYQALGDSADYDLVVPQITGGELDRETTIRCCAGIEAGTGLAAFHHGLATTFPGNARFR